MTRKTSPRTPDMARKIWLAGIGAYGRAFSEAHESLSRVGEGSSKIFEELVAKGEQIEQTVEQAVETTGRAVAARVAPSGASFDDRIRRMRERLGLVEHDAPTRSELSAIEARLTRIEGKLDALLATRGADKQGAAKKSAASKPATKKTTPAKKRALSARR